MLAVMFDQELYAIFNDGKVIMPGTGVAPFIHKVIMGIEKPEIPWKTFDLSCRCRNCCQRILILAIQPERNRTPL